MTSIISYRRKAEFQPKLAKRGGVRQDWRLTCRCTVLELMETPVSDWLNWVSNWLNWV